MSDEKSRPALPGPPVERLGEMLGEIADLNEALGRYVDDNPTAWRVLHNEMDHRLARAIELVATGREEASS